MSDETRELSRMGRRRFGKNLSAMGIAGATLNYLTPDSLASNVGDINDEVPYVAFLAYRNPDANVKDADESGRAPVYRTMPRDRWQINRAAVNASERVLQRVKNQIGMRDDVGVEVRTDGKSVANRIVVVSTRIVGQSDNLTDLSKLHDAAPKRGEGVVGEGKYRYKQQFPVDVESVEIENQAYYDSNYDGSIPGGCQISVPHHLIDPKGTSTCGAELEKDGNQLMVTAGHVLDEIQPSEWNEVYQPHEGGDLIGDHGWDHTSKYFDAGYSFHSDGIQAGTKLANDSGGRKSEPIDGIIPYNAIQESIGNSSYSMRIQGRSSGLGYVYPTGLRSGMNGFAFQFKTSIPNPNTMNGDSGGPHFKKDNGFVYIGGVHKGLSSVDNEPVATSAEYVETHFDLKIPVLNRGTLPL